MKDTTLPATITKDIIWSYLKSFGLVNKLNKDEANRFYEIAKAYNLDPFKREIHVSKYGPECSIIMGYEVYLKRAEDTGLLDGWKVWTKGSVKTGDLKGCIEIHRKDRKHPFYWEVDFDEFVAKTKEGVITKFWQKARFMIRKVAISQGFRLCFPKDLGGMPYTADELGQDPSVVEAEYKEITKQQGDNNERN